LLREITPVLIGEYARWAIEPVRPYEEEKNLLFLPGLEKRIDQHVD
jgi:hypothetical protein